MVFFNVFGFSKFLWPKRKVISRFWLRSLKLINYGTFSSISLPVQVWKREHLVDNRCSNGCRHVCGGVLLVSTYFSVIVKGCWKCNSMEYKTTPATPNYENTLPSFSLSLVILCSGEIGLGKATVLFCLLFKREHVIITLGCILFISSTGTPITRHIFPPYMGTIPSRFVFDCRPRPQTEQLLDQIL